MGTSYERKDRTLHKGKNMKNEIEKYKKLLGEYNLTFNDLTNAQPKDIEIRKSTIKIARFIAGNEALTTFIKEKKKLPVNELKKLLSVSRITIMCYKKYIIALALIYIGKFTCMENYINI